MDERRPDLPVDLARTRSLGRAVPITTFLIGIFIGAALVKPWDLLSRPSRTPIPQTAADASSGSTQTAAPSGPPVECAFAGGWRVFALGQPDPLGGNGSTASSSGPGDEPSGVADIGNPLKRWLEINPLPTATSPADPRIPFVTIVSDRIAGIGYCPPPDGADGPPPGARFEAWSLDAAGAPTAMPLRRIVADPATAIEVDVFIGADQAASGRARWPPGRYVFAIEAADRSGYGRWLGVEIRRPPGKEPGPG